MNKQTVIPLSLLLIFIIGCASRTTIKPFTSDDCSCWPEGYDQKRQWEECCREHDLAYWAGGSYQERLEADERLRECVERTGDSAVARLMFYGVRVGGTAFL
ncbi:MAG: FAD-binding oxidoreductase, partial [Chitinivibrionales bacterium]